MNRITSLQALRAAAFIAIFLSHCDILPTGPVGVSVFLVLSGFLMYNSSYVKKREPQIKGSFGFAAGKISKLYPLHLLTFFAVAGLSVIRGFEGGHIIPKALLNALLLQSWVPDSGWYFTFNKVSWYLSVCLFVYFAFPFLYGRVRCGKVGQACGRGAVVLVLQIVFSAAMCTVLSEYMDRDLQKWTTYILPLYRTFDFYYGMILGRVYHEYLSEKKPSFAALTTVETALAMLWAVQVVLYKQVGLIPEAFRYSLYWLPTSIAAVLLFTLNGGAITKALSCKAVIFIGDISAVAFLTHQMIIGVCEIVIKNRYAVAVTAFAVTAAASFVYTKLEAAVRARLKRQKMSETE